MLATSGHLFELRYFEGFVEELSMNVKTERQTVWIDAVGALAYGLIVWAILKLTSTLDSRLASLSAALAVGILVSFIAQGVKQRIARHHSRWSLDPRTNPLVLQGLVWLVVVAAVGVWLENRLHQKVSSDFDRIWYFAAIFFWCEAIAFVSGYFRR